MNPPDNPFVWVYPNRLIAGGICAAALLCLTSLWVDWVALRLLTKWVPAALLALWVVRAATGRPRLLAATGLLFSAVGDLTLEGNYITAGSGVPWFAVGLGFFLLAHLAYIPMFLSLQHVRTWKPYLPIALYVGVFLAVLWPNLGAMRIPVFFYVLVISLMIWSGFCVRPPAGVPAWQRHCAAWGAVVFAASDSMIAINKFLTPFAGAREAILLTYWLAQFGIASAAVNFPRAGARG